MNSWVCMFNCDSPNGHMAFAAYAAVTGPLVERVTSYLTLAVSTTGHKGQTLLATIIEGILPTPYKQ